LILDSIGVEKDYKVKPCWSYKKTRNGKLGTQQKEVNKKLNQFRVVVENAVDGVKWYCCISDIWRNRSERLKDGLMFLSL